MQPGNYVETFLISLALFAGIMAYIQIRSVKILTVENQAYKKDKRALEAKVQQLEVALDHAQKTQATTTVVTTSASEMQLKDKFKQLTGEHELLKAQYNSALDTLGKIKTTVEKPENLSNSLSIRIKTYLMAIASLTA